MPRLPVPPRLCAVLWMLAVLLGAHHGHADELADRLKAFRDTVAPQFAALEAEASADEPKSDDESPRRISRKQIVHAIRQLIEQAETTEPDAFKSQFTDLLRYVTVPPALKQSVDEFMADLARLNAERFERWLSTVEALVKKTGPACLAAKAEGELDPLLREIGEAQQERSAGRRSEQAVERAQRRLQGAAQAVSTWQDYLAHHALGHSAGATAALKRLLDPSSYPIVAREEIEKRLATPEPAKPAAAAPTMPDWLGVIGGVERIEELAKAVATLRQTAPASGQSSESAILQTLEQLVADHATFAAGFYAAAFQAAAGASGRGGSVLPGPWVAQITRFRGQLLLAVLPRYLELRDISAPQADEAASDYLLRLLGELAPQRRFLDAARVLETYRTVAFGRAGQEPGWVAADLEGLSAFATAERFAQVELWAEAINRYRRAAEAPGRFTPSQEAAQHMAELKQKHPEEARAAEQLAETEATYLRLSREAASSAQRAIESRLPFEMRDRMRRYPGFPP